LTPAIRLSGICPELLRTPTCLFLRFPVSLPDALFVPSPLRPAPEPDPISPMLGYHNAHPVPSRLSADRALPKPSHGEDLSLSDPPAFLGFSADPLRDNSLSILGADDFLPPSVAEPPSLFRPSSGRSWFPALRGLLTSLLTLLNWRIRLCGYHCLFFSEFPLYVGFNSSLDTGTSGWKADTSELLPGQLGLCENLCVLQDCFPYTSGPALEILPPS